MRKSRGITTYSGAHRNTTLVRGRAADHECCNCGGAAHEWAMKHGVLSQTDARGVRFSTDPFDYQPMCRGCHRRYDKEHIISCPKGHEYSPQNTLLDGGKRKCRKCVYDRNTARRAATPMTPGQKARKAELQRVRRAQIGEVSA